MNHSNDSWNQVVAKVKKQRAKMPKKRRFDDTEHLRFHKHKPMPFWAKNEEAESLKLALLAALIVVFLPQAINWLFNLIDVVMK